MKIHDVFPNVDKANDGRNYCKAGKILAAIADQNGISLFRLGKKLGISNTSLQAYLSGHNHLTPFVVGKIVKECGLNAAQQRVFRKAVIEDISKMFFDVDSLSYPGKKCLWLIAEKANDLSQVQIQEILHILQRDNEEIDDRR